MADRVKDSREDGVAILTLPTVLTTDTCAELDAALVKALNARDVSGLVLIAEGPDFCMGFDLLAQDHARLAGSFATLARRIETSSKPVVAALCGKVRNEGVDLAICAQARVAHSDTTIAMTSVEVATLPGGGATQRLPRLLGPDVSLDMMLNAATWPITHKGLAGFADAIVVDDVKSAAKRWAQGAQKTPMTVNVTPVAFRMALADIRQRFPNPSNAQADIIDCVEAALLLPVSSGLAFETARYVERCGDRLSHVLRHAVVADGKARQLPHTMAETARPVRRVAVMGRSSEAADLAAMSVRQGWDVWIEGGVPERGRALVDLTLKRLQQHTGHSNEASERLHVDATGAEMEHADLIFDTAELTPDPPVALKDGAVWVFTSPDVAIVDRAQEVQAPGRTVRLNRLLRSSGLIELSGSKDTADMAVATAHSALSGDQQSVVMTADVPGGLVGALFCAVARSALVMLAAGASPDAIENAARKRGLRQGPMQMMDVLGPGRALELMRQVYAQRGASLAPLKMLSDRMADVTDGDENRARRALIFHTPVGQSFALDADLSDWLDEWRDDHPERAPDWPDVDLEEAFHAALVSEAARLLQRRVVQRASDIDLAAQKGLFMDERLGGPLIQADLSGLLGIKTMLRQLDAIDPALWTCEPLIDDMIKNGRRFF